MWGHISILAIIKGDGDHKALCRTGARDTTVCAINYAEDSADIATRSSSVSYLGGIYSSAEIGSRYRLAGPPIPVSSFIQVCILALSRS